MLSLFSKGKVATNAAARSLKGSQNSRNFRGPPIMIKLSLFLRSYADTSITLRGSFPFAR